MSTSERNLENGIHRSFKFPTTEYFNPEELGVVYAAFRDWKLKNAHDFDLETNYPRFSAKGLESLIRNCYIASQMAEEGRYPKFQVVISGYTDIDFQLRFKEPTLVDPSFLRRIAAAVPSSSGLYLSETNENMHCEGVIPNLWQQLFTGPRVRRLNRAPNKSICIRVDSPGQLVIVLESHHCRVAGGRVSFPVEIGVDDRYRSWLKDLAKWIGTQLKHPEQHGYSGAHLLGAVEDDCVESIWARIIELCQSMRHGGTFIIRPKELTEGISFKYSTTSLHLGKEIVTRLNSIDGDGIRTTIERQALLNHAELIAQISTVDGCVVFDRELNLEGFGGHIQVDDELLAKSTRTPANDSGQTISEDFLTQHGSRHKSAFRLCKAYPEHLAFVVSQDGAVTMFSSDQNHVYKSHFPDFPTSVGYW